MIVKCELLAVNNGIGHPIKGAFFCIEPLFSVFLLS